MKIVMHHLHGAFVDLSAAAIHVFILLFVITALADAAFRMAAAIQRHFEYEVSMQKQQKAPRPTVVIVFLNSNVFTRDWGAGANDNV